MKDISGAPRQKRSATGTRLARQKWRKGYMPIWKDHHIERAWLDEHWGYGGRVNTIAAGALVEALKQSRNRAEGHALFIKLFAEYGNALEVAGAWGWAVRTRRDNSLFLDSLLTYSDEWPRLFYAAARRNRSGSVKHLLALPSEARALEALRTAQSDLSDAELRTWLDGAVPEAKSLAGRYFSEEQVVSQTYNRVKHGAALLHDESQHSRAFYVVGPNLRQGDSRRYRLAEFTVDRKAVENTARLVAKAEALTVFFATLAKGLEITGGLYPGKQLPPRPASD